MINTIFANRRQNELNILAEIDLQSAQGALLSLLKNALLTNTKHLRGDLIKLCQRNGYSAPEARTALYLIERADWVRTIAEDTQVYVYLTEHAVLTAGGA